MTPHAACNLLTYSIRKSKEYQGFFRVPLYNTCDLVPHDFLLIKGVQLARN